VTKRCATLVLSFAVLHGAHAQDAARNPFGRPPAESVPETALERAAPSPGTLAPAFKLRATMTAGDRSLVNVDGEIVRLGEEIAGYRLVAVGEGTAVFARDGRRFPLTMNPEASADEDQP
jgi:hypothetical protein